MKFILDFTYDQLSKKMRIINWYATRHSIRFMREYFHNKELVGAEIGVLRGANTLNLFRHLNIKKIYLIDPYMLYPGIDGPQKVSMEKTFNYAKQALYRYRDKCVFVKKLSNDAVDDVPNNLDFIYIDGNHLYRYVKNDLSLYYPKVSKRGVVSGHDFDYPDVARAVMEFLGQKGITPKTFGYPTDWWFIKEE